MMSASGSSQSLPEVSGAFLQSVPTKLHLQAARLIRLTKTAQAVLLQVHRGPAILHHATRLLRFLSP